MNAITKITEPVVGLNIPAEVGMALGDVSTPALIVDLGAFERNVKQMREFNERMGVRHRLQRFFQATRSVTGIPSRAILFRIETPIPASTR